MSQTLSPLCVLFFFSLFKKKKQLRTRLTQNAFLALRQMFWCHQNLNIRRFILIMTFPDGAAQLSHSVIWLDENALNSALFEQENCLWWLAECFWCVSLVPASRGNGWKRSKGQWRNFSRPQREEVLGDKPKLGQELCNVQTFIINLHHKSSARLPVIKRAPLTRFTLFFYLVKVPNVQLFIAINKHGTLYGNIYFENKD